MLPQHTSTKKLQRQISHFFNAYAGRTGKSLEEIGKDLGVSREAISHYKASEDNRITNAFITLERVGRLDQMTAIEFCSYLANTPLKKGSLFPWERILLEKFNTVSHVFRRQFIHHYLNKADPQALTEVLELVLRFTRLDPAKQQMLLAMMESWEK